jgi:GNAT superfamily N-acetyltransferase
MSTEGGLGEEGDAMAETRTDVSIRPLEEGDLPEADRIMRVAFGTFLGLPDPSGFMGDADYVGTRWLADPSAAFGAYVGDEVVGSNFATNWGSVGHFGPLTIRPDLWNRGVGSRLMEPIMECFARWGTEHAGLFTFADSPGHIHLYEKFGFWAGHLTAVMSKPVAEKRPPALRWVRFSELSEGDRAAILDSCRELTDAVYEGLDLEREMRAVEAQGLGDTVLLWEDAHLVGLAVCHWGGGTEAGSGGFYIKFGAIRPGPEAGEHFERLLDACEALATTQGAQRLIAGVNMGRHEAYRALLTRGFRTDLQAVAMHKPNEPGYNRSEVYVIDDWR